MAKASVSLGRFEPRRLDELIRMWRASFEAGVGIADPHPLSEQREAFLTRVLPEHDVRVACLADDLVGFVAASAESLSQLYVRVGYHRRGIGTQMLDWAKARSGGSLWLYTFARNLNARAFYERHGFVAIEHGFEPNWQLEDVKYRWTAR